MHGSCFHNQMGVQYVSLPCMHGYICYTLYTILILTQQISVNLALLFDMHIFPPEDLFNK